ncbi:MULTISPECIES: hypothetical protein [Paenibacillus]|jgi:hypothetical protein|uniref:Uncharacterized protein n=2 Tax=Paenibacillus barengoltzii TaxID=343517 RepID=R9LDW8_9BACL|nr:MULTISPECIES: hypothetical protein [Paenibacillus]EOS56581.1 hypothetical protein C812_01977 [Paenibacillus barengoltzii G22]MEC2343936.1 hypothetical protein [Paenibacillus barengoltzii]SME94138.1 hypothetical protein SAMN02744102_00433 [Paenibacillus barengoltzii]SMF21081.1 hypothetical protein SAMN02744124_01846 [Paenibacillus barengoltzii J12]
MENNKLIKLQVEEPRIKSATNFLQDKGVSLELNSPQLYKYKNTKYLILSAKSKPELFVLSYNENDELVEVTTKSTLLNQSGNVIENHFTGKEKKLAVDDNKQNNFTPAANTASSCPPGQEWREYNCKYVPELNEFCLIACAAAKIKPSLCINMCTNNIKTCETDCFPIDGGIPT